jgi:hypothetical protein
MDKMDIDSSTASLSPRKTACYNCQRMLDEGFHGKDGCHYHRGFLVSNGAPSGISHGSHDSRWSCCNLPSSNRGCHWGRHLLKRSAVESVWSFPVVDGRANKLKRWRPSNALWAADANANANANAHANSNPNPNAIASQPLSMSCGLEEAAFAPYPAKRQRVQLY